MLNSGACPGDLVAPSAGPSRRPPQRQMCLTAPSPATTPPCRAFRSGGAKIASRFHGAAESGVSQLRCRRSGRAWPTSTGTTTATRRWTSSGKSSSSSRPGKHGQQGRLGGDGVPRHPGRRQRSRHPASADAAPAADRGGDPTRRPSALVRSGRPGARPGQDLVPARRAAVGGGGRHLPGRLPLLRQDRVPRVLRRQPRLAAARADDRVRHLRARLRPRSACCCRGATTSTCTRWRATTCRPRRWA